jgi:energy-coupling factor transporter ATP-binding protein EcfA2
MSTTKERPFGILNVEIRDFRGIADLTLPWGDALGHPNKVFVLAGTNGSGKTTVLEACLLALGQHDLLLGPWGKNAIRSGAKDYSITIQIQTSHGTYRGITTATGDAEWNNEDMSTKSLAPAIPPIWYFSSWRAPKLTGALSITAGTQGKRPKDSEANRLERAKQYLVNAKAHSFMNGAHAPSVYDDAIGKLNRVWRNFYPGSNQSFAVEPISRAPEEGFDVYLKDGGHERISVDFLSSGQLEIFGFFAAIIEAKEPPQLVVMDEPELHLDPAWHTLFVRSMRESFPETQFLLATHSPDIYDSVYSFQRRLLLPDDDPRLKAWRKEIQGATP